MFYFLYYRLLWLLDEYTSGVQTDKTVTIETENINIQVVNVTHPEQEFHYEPSLEENNKITQVRLGKQ